MKTQLMMGVGGFGLFAALTAVAQPEAEWLVQAAAKKGYAALRRDHLADVARLMGAVRQELE